MSQDIDVSTPEGLANWMGQTTDGRDWDRRAQIVLDLNHGKYPDFWWETVIASGLYMRVVPNGGITVMNLDEDGNVVSQKTYDPGTGQRIS